MKKRNWFRALSLADEEYLAEADPARTVRPKRRKAWVSVLAACACLALIFGNLWLFIPFSTTPPDVTAYADSAYYDLIQKLNVLTFQKPRYKNNAAWLWAGIKSLSWRVKDEMNMSGGAGAPEDALADAYREVTDNQVQGIIEADRIKRTDTHIYYLDDEVLRVFAIDKENTKEVGRYTLYDGSKNYFLDQWEFYLSADGKTVTVITQYYGNTNTNADRHVGLIALDVSDPTNITKKQEFSITGEYMSSRLADGSILLLTGFVINRQELDFDDERTFLPQIDEGEGPYSIPADSILSPDQLNSSRYTVVLKLDESTLELRGTAAYLSYSEDVYVSENHVFLTHVFAESVQNADSTLTRNSMTRISCLAYGDGFEKKGDVTVRGYVKDQWSMDEYEGVLRVVTTTNATTVRKRSDENGNVSADILQTATGMSNASLYCIDLATFKVIASVIDFAPPREEVQSVRFDGKTAYVCTSIELSDPVFFFDLSDLDNITYKDTGTIEGFSTSLINLGNGYLLGIGRGESWSSFKVEVYEETADGVRAVCAYELEHATYSTEYKSYFVDRQNGLIGIGVVDNSYYDFDKYSGEARRYLLLHFDGYELLELVNVPLNGDPANMRGVYIDGYLYAFGFESFQVVKVFDQ